MKSPTLVCAGFALLLAAIPVAAQQNACGDLRNAYGPYDYWSENDKIGVVEAFHFTSEVETLRSGKSSTLGGDLDYTLRASPNHPRALVSMMRLAERDKVKRPQGAQYAIDCYFERAIRFRPKDGMVRLIFASYLSKTGNGGEALKQLEIAAQSGLDTGNFHYNLGLAYFDAKEYEKALRAAHRAYSLGFNLPGLKSKLVKAGKWQDAPPAPPPARDAAATTADGASTGGPDKSAVAEPVPGQAKQ